MTDLFADGTISIHGAQATNLKDVSLDIFLSIKRLYLLVFLGLVNPL